ncbi:MAG: hypothetical protein AAFU66_10755, partial [Pseudomonadota bacterium]
RLAETGHRLVCTDDYDHADAEMAECQKPYYTPHLSRQHNDFSSANSFWALLYQDEAEDPADRLVGTIGVRVDEIPKSGLAEYWYHHYRRLRDTGFGGDIDRQYEPNAVKSIYGKVAYVGDYFALPKGRVDQHYYMLAAFIYAQIKWSPDFLYGFVRRAHAEKGQTYRLGFQHHARSVHRWISCPEHRADDDVMIYNSADDVRDVVSVMLGASANNKKTSGKVVQLRGGRAKL